MDSTDLPAPAGPGVVLLPAGRWLPLAHEHAARADACTAGHRARRATGAVHAIDDFLYDYYALRPSALRRWHPGAGVTLAGTTEQVGERAGWRWHIATADGVTLDVDAFRADRGSTVRYIRDLLTATAARRPHTGCFGLHEWAMVFRQDDSRRRHTLPLRLGREGRDAVVEAHQIRCSHFDAYRFFTPDAVGRNALQPTRDTQVDLEQPGCLHANMDCLKWALKLGPAVPGDLLLDCFELAREIRALDMQASPYDVSSLGEPVVAIETPDGKAEYAARQRAFAESASHLRKRLVNASERVLTP
jgi:hypothetical protein